MIRLQVTATWASPVTTRVGIGLTWAFPRGTHSMSSALRGTGRVRIIHAYTIYHNTNLNIHAIMLLDQSRYILHDRIYSIIMKKYIRCTYHYFVIQSPNGVNKTNFPIRSFSPKIIHVILSWSFFLCIKRSIISHFKK